MSQSILALPKVELHVHLEGATDADTVWEMAGRNGVSLPAATLQQWRSHYAFRDFSHFIDVYGQATSVMQQPGDWTLMVLRFMENQARQNIVYSEVFLSASYQVDRLPTSQWVAALVAGAVKGEAEYGTRIRFIPDISRHLPATQSAVLDFVSSGLETGYFVGLGLGGIEDGFPASLFRDTFVQARQRGLHVVAHAGETTGSPTIWEAINDLRVERIGHGIRCLEDRELVAHLRETRMPMEVCPTSNYCLGVVDHDAAHPIREMVDAGVLCTVNSDDPPMFGTTLTSEYERLARQGFSWDELRQLNLNAIDSSFLPQSEKDELRERAEAAT